MSATDYNTSIVFVSRNPVPKTIYNDPGAVPGLGPEYRTVPVGGKLLVRKEDGSIRTLAGSDRLYDVADPCVSWDATMIVISGLEHPDSNWRIYQINADGSRFEQLTFTDRSLDLSQFGAAAGFLTRYDDFDPCYLPDGRIVFASTRYPSIASYNQLLTSNLFVVDANGNGIKRITTERNGGEEPAIDPISGRIVYARWWVNRDRPSNETRHGLSRTDNQALTDDVANIWQAVTIRPDGTELKLYAGFPRTRFGTQTYKPSLLYDGRLLSVFSPHSAMVPTVGGTGIRWFNKGADFEHYVVGVRSDESLRQIAIIEAPYATDPVQLAGETILFSYSADGNDYGVYSCKLDGSDLQKVIDLPGTHELDVQVLQPRPVPPIIKDEFPAPLSDLPPTEDPDTYYKNNTFRFDCMNIYANGAVDEPMPNAPRITTNARIRFYMNVQRQNPYYPDPSIFLKEAEVSVMGGVHEDDVPADVPLFEQVVDGKGNVLETSDGKFAHATGMNFERMGAGAKCVGCHAGHSMITVPVNKSLAEWFNVSPSAVVSASSFFTSEKGETYGPQRVVDRQARTGGDTVAWVANEGAGAFVQLRWEIPVEVKQFVIYGVKQNPQKGTTIKVDDCTIVLYYGSLEVGRIASTGTISENGTSISISPTDIDAARIIINDITGTVNELSMAALAEVETVARISKLNYTLSPGK